LDHHVDIVVHTGCYGQQRQHITWQKNQYSARPSSS